MFKIIFIDLPEILFIIGFIMILFDKTTLAINNKNILKFIITVFVFILLEILIDKYCIILNINQYYRFFLIYINFCIMIVIIYKILYLVNIFKIFIYGFFAFIVIQLLEISFIPIILYAANISIKELLTNEYLLFGFSIPLRIIQFSIISYIYNKEIIKEGSVKL